MKLTNDLQESLGIAAIILAIFIGVGILIGLAGLVAALDSKPCAERTK